MEDFTHLAFLPFDFFFPSGFLNFRLQGHEAIHGWDWQTAFYSAENTQDSVEDEQQLGRVKDWISGRHLDTVELTDVLSNFPDISVVIFFFLFFLGKN